MTAASTAAPRQANRPASNAAAANAIRERVQYLRDMAGMYFTLCKDIAATQDALDEAHDRLGRAKLVTDAFSAAADEPHAVASDGYTYPLSTLQQLFAKAQPYATGSVPGSQAVPNTSEADVSVTHAHEIEAALDPNVKKSKADTDCDVAAVGEAGAARVYLPSSSPAPLNVQSSMTGEPLIVGCAYSNHNLTLLMRHLRAVLQQRTDESGADRTSPTSDLNHAAVAPYQRKELASAD